MSTSKMTLMHERMAKLEVNFLHQSKKVDEIHRALIGNGQVGLLAEWNQWKGGIRLFGRIIGVIMGILTFMIGLLVYIK